MGGKLEVEMMLLILRVKNWFSLLPESGRDSNCGDYLSVSLSICRILFKTTFGLTHGRIM
jgi:hypothetical protein